MDANGGIDQGMERGRWQEKVLNFQNASVYLQLIMSKRSQAPSADDGAEPQAKSAQESLDDTFNEDV